MENYLEKNYQKLFFKIHKNLLLFVNKRIKASINLNDLSDWGKYENFMIDIAILRNHLFENKYLIDQFIEANPADFISQELSITKYWKNTIIGDFVLLKHLKYQSIFLDTKRDKIYGVKGLMEGIDALIPTYQLPMFVNTALIPFSGRIVYDGILQASNIVIGNSYIDSFMADYNRIKKKNGIITYFANE
jgi:hypothetical protein